MWEWIGIGVLYALGIGFFRLLGGFASAGEAIRRWGAAEGERRRDEMVARLRR